MPSIFSQGPFQSQRNYILLTSLHTRDPALWWCSEIISIHCFDGWPKRCFHERFEHVLVIWASCMGLNATNSPCSLMLNWSKYSIRGLHRWTLRYEHLDTNCSQYEWFQPVVWILQFEIFSCEKLNATNSHEATAVVIHGSQSIIDAMHHFIFCRNRYVVSSCVRLTRAEKQIFSLNQENGWQRQENVLQSNRRQTDPAFVQIDRKRSLIFFRSRET